MRLGGNQPFFFPYIPYYQLMKNVDVFMIADDFNYSRAWTNRNYMLLRGRERFMFNLVVLGASQNKLVNEVRVADDQYKLLKTIEINYRKAPFFKDVFPMVEKILAYGDKNLARYLGNSLVTTANYLGFDTKFIYSSEIEGKDHTLRFQNRVLNLCTVLKADEYVNLGGEDEHPLYDRKAFKQCGIDLYYIKSGPVEYKQFNNPFISNLSMLDVLMFNSIEQTNELLTQFELV
ncbi:MAG: WbqC family protein [Bacteroidales bacterium]|jgi:hypothetical protein|nr:WbqC family protein [Bacteroidales bacterium]